MRASSRRPVKSFDHFGSKGQLKVNIVKGDNHERKLRTRESRKDETLRAYSRRSLAQIVDKMVKLR